MAQKHEGQQLRRTSEAQKTHIVDRFPRPADRVPSRHLRVGVDHAMERVRERSEKTSTPALVRSTLRRNEADGNRRGFSWGWERALGVAVVADDANAGERLLEPLGLLLAPLEILECAALRFEQFACDLVLEVLEVSVLQQRLDDGGELGVLG